MGKKVLLFGSMGEISAVAGEALMRAGHDVVAVPFPQNLLRDESGYCRELMKAVDTFHPDCILPVGNTVAISRIKEKVTGLPHIIADSSANTEILDSKVSASKLAARVGIPQPPMFNSPEEVERFPVIFKLDRSFAGCGVYKPSTKEALLNIVEHFAGKRYLIEEYVEGNDWSVDAVRFYGYFRCGCYRSFGSRGQSPATERETADNPLLVRYAEKMLDALDYHGVCGFDFRVDNNGQAYFLECNPRLTGGLATQIAAGFDIPSLLVTH